MILVDDQTHWFKMSDFVSLEILYIRKLRGRFASSVEASGQGGDTFIS